MEGNFPISYKYVSYGLEICLRPLAILSISINNMTRFSRFMQTKLTLKDIREKLMPSLNASCSFRKWNNSFFKLGTFWFCNLYLYLKYFYWKRGTMYLFWHPHTMSFLDYDYSNNHALILRKICNRAINYCINYPRFWFCCWLWRISLWIHFFCMSNILQLCLQPLEVGPLKTVGTCQMAYYTSPVAWYLFDCKFSIYTRSFITD